jgi:hypothetical protein
VLGDRGQVLQAVGGEVAYAEGVGVGDVPVGFAGVAVVDPLGRHPGAQGLDDLVGAGRVAPGAAGAECFDDLVEGAGFDGEAHGDLGQLFA